ncbi:MAG: cytochrome c family protein, partial [Pseudolabrys sp.]|nr:cytochrome c family protein [Pseudolabrys sp.]
AGKNRVGPSMAGIVGRKSGTVEGFRYSAANKNADITWTPEVLETYLTNPKAVVPGTTMAYVGLRNATQRADLIAYLVSLK